MMTKKTEVRRTLSSSYNAKLVMKIRLNMVSSRNKITVIVLINNDHFIHWNGCPNQSVTH